jgi:hypothetical protein
VAAPVLDLAAPAGEGDYTVRPVATQGPQQGRPSRGVATNSGTRQWAAATAVAWADVPCGAWA